MCLLYDDSLYQDPVKQSHSVILKCNINVKNQSCAFIKRGVPPITIYVLLLINVLPLHFLRDKDKEEEDPEDKIHFKTKLGEASFFTSFIMLDHLYQITGRRLKG